MNKKTLHQSEQKNAPTELTETRPIKVNKTRPMLSYADDLHLSAQPCNLWALILEQGCAEQITTKQTKRRTTDCKKTNTPKDKTNRTAKQSKRQSKANE